MNRKLAIGVAALLACRAEPAEIPAPWRDASPHAVRMVTVAPDVALEVLDWGGSGRPLVLLGGLGDAAHIYDDVAPTLTDSFHIFAITRRGFGASSKPPATEMATLLTDLRAVLDSLGLTRVILVGHSLAGDELTAFAGSHPDYCAALVYLDAAHDRSHLLQLWQSNPFPPPPAMTAADSVSPEAFGSYLVKLYGLRFPGAEVRAIARFDSTGRYLGDVTPDSMAFGILTHLSRPNYARVQCPSLAIYAIPDSAAVMVPTFATLDSAGRAQAGRVFLAFSGFIRASESQYRREAAAGRVLEIHNANHYVFLSHREQTLGAVRDFLSALPNP